jgi:hypothetical protein
MMEVRGPVFAANWKMHLGPDETREFVSPRHEMTGRWCSFRPP